MPEYIIYRGQMMTKEEYHKAREEEGNDLLIAMGHLYYSDAGAEPADISENDSK